MTHPAKKFFFGSSVALCLLGSAWGQVTNSISFTNSATSIENTTETLSLSKFNSSLGTLTGVTVTVNFVSIGGSFSVTTTSASPTEVFSASSALRIRQSATNTIGFTQLGTTSFTIGTAPALEFEVPGNSTQVFTLTPTNVFVAQAQNISSNFWSAYSSAGGSGVVDFEFRNSPTAPSSGGSFSQSLLNFSATANMTVTYTYTSAEPIPEPSTVAAGAFLTVLAAASYWRRRRSAR